MSAVGRKIMLEAGRLVIGILAQILAVILVFALPAIWISFGLKLEWYHVALLGVAAVPIWLWWLRRKLASFGQEDPQ